VLEYIEGGLEACAEFERSHCGVTGMPYDTIGVKALELPNEETRIQKGIFADHNHLQFLFLEPNASDPLNKEAAEDLRSNREGFKRNVRTSMSGGAVKGQQYERVIKG